MFILSLIHIYLFPVGRLDIDTEGLLLLTNDGELAHQLLSPKKHVDKQYYARVAGTLPPDSKEQIAAGMTLSDGTQVMPCLLYTSRNVTKNKPVVRQEKNASVRLSHDRRI